MIQTVDESTAFRGDPATYGYAASGGLWHPSRHHLYLADRVQAAVARGSGRLVVNMPPRHGKSELVSHWTPTWYLDEHPGKNVILVSYNDTEARRWGRKVRDEFMGNSFCRRKVRRDSSDAARWEFADQYGGGMIATGMGGSLTGRGGDLIIIDDPIKNDKEAASTNYQRDQREWFQATLYDRLEPGGTIIVMGHRWHEDDIFGFILEQHNDDWERIALPMVAGKDDPIGRKPGQLLWPNRVGVKQARRMKKAMGIYWHSKCQQSPESMKGGTLYHHFAATNVSEAVEIAEDRPIDVAFDFNINPGMHVVVGQEFPDLDLLTAVHEIHEVGMDLESSLEEFIAWYAKRCPHKPRVRVFGDATGRRRDIRDGKSNWAIVRSRLVLAGIKIDYMVRRANPRVIDSVNTMNEALRDSAGVVHYMMHPTCKRLAADFKKLRRGQDGGINKADLDLSHASDAERYRVTVLRPIRSARDLERSSGARFNV